MARKPSVEDSLAGKTVKYDTYYKNTVERTLKGLELNRKPEPKKKEIKIPCR